VEKSISISFQCTSCDADFELEIPRVIDRPTALKCPNCNARPPAHRAHALGTAIEDLLSAMAAIRTKVRFELSLDTEELPPPYGPAEPAEGQGLGDLADDLDVDADGEDDDDDDEDEDNDEDEDEDEDRDFDDDEEGDEDEEEEGESDDEDYDFDEDEDDDDDEEEEEEEEED
jgi:DNA-directed RNA polymerase subunit RPC12/RpoP